MRPHLTFFATPDVLTNYDLRPGQQLLGGTLIAATPTRLRDRFAQFQAAGPFVHITLSAPAGLWLEREIWQRVFRYVLDRHGLPADLTPWVQVRHINADCDHAHGLAASASFTGRPLKVRTDPIYTDETHRRVARLLGLEEPYYYDPSVGPRVQAHAPARRLRGEPRDHPPASRR